MSLDNPNKKTQINAKPKLVTTANKTSKEYVLKEVKREKLEEYIDTLLSNYNDQLKNPVLNEQMLAIHNVISGGHGALVDLRSWLVQEEAKVIDNVEGF